MNSAAGLGGLIISKTFLFNWNFAFPLIGAVVIGGTLGSYLTNTKFNINSIRIFTAILVTYVGLRLILLHSFGVKI